MESTATATATPSNDDLVAAAMEATNGPPQPREETYKLKEAEVPKVSSPTLEALDKLRRPQPATVCESCPNSVWFTSPTEVKCYCRVMYLVTWSVKEPNQITACDGLFVDRE